MSILGDIFRYIFDREDYDLEPFRHPTTYSAPEPQGEFPEYCQPYEVEYRTDKEKAFNEFLRDLPSAPGKHSMSLLQSRNMDVLHGDWRTEFAKTDPYYMTFEEKRAWFETMWEERQEKEESERFMRDWDIETAREMHNRRKHNQLEIEHGLWEGKHPPVRDNRFDTAHGYKHDPIPVGWFGTDSDVDESFSDQDTEELPLISNVDDDQMLAEIDRAAEEYRWDDYNRLVEEYCRR